MNPLTLFLVVAGGVIAGAVVLKKITPPVPSSRPAKRYRAIVETGHTQVTFPPPGARN